MTVECICFCFFALTVSLADRDLRSLMLQLPGIMPFVATMLSEHPTTEHVAIILEFIRIHLEAEAMAYRWKYDVQCEKNEFQRMSMLRQECLRLFELLKHSNGRAVRFHFFI